MADPRGFLKAGRELPKRRPVDVRIMDWREVYEPFSAEKLHAQAGRCMDCGIPFCHNGCPLGNLIPEWNDLVWRDDWRVGYRTAACHQQLPRVHRPTVSGALRDRLCARDQPARRHDQAGGGSASSTEPGKKVGCTPQPPDRQSGKTVAVVGSGPAGLAAAQQLARAGHTVAVYEREDRIGGLLRYGIPEFKMEKHNLIVGWPNGSRRGAVPAGHRNRHRHQRIEPEGALRRCRAGSGSHPMA